MKILTIFALHTSTEQKIKTTLNNYNILKKYSNKTIFVDSVENKDKIKNVINDNINNIFLYIVNDIYRDYSKWIFGLNNINIYNYDRIILINDSILFIRDIPDFISILNDEYEIYGMNGSNEHSFHIQSYIMAFSINGINKYIKYFNNNKDTFHSKYFPQHKEHAINCYNDLIILFNNDNNYNLNNILNKCNNLIDVDFLDVNKCVRISNINNKKEFLNLCKIFYFEYLLIKALISVFEIKITSFFNNYKILYETTTNINITLNNDSCKDYLLNKNYPLIKLKKLNNLNKDEKYILDLIKDRI